ncbi:uncharacterized protein LOC118183371 [Stegodyphus dumicola]|uniref:uncharacterized protein LOC118183371 n=1 Tax=Stegodyphus dumicola TaxID=202533 RepID=UPI0015A89B2A|nr:uncharacterized protein LOC118183371 [Stegodyphus dumicola]
MAVNNNSTGNQTTQPTTSRISVLGADPLVSIPTFSGGEGSTQLSDFIDRVNLVAAHVGWTDSDKLTAIKVKLEGEAAAFIRSNPRLKNESNLVAVVDALKDRFSTLHNLHAHIRALIQAFQKPRETVRQFAARIEALSCKTVPLDKIEDPTVKSQRLDLLLSVFLEGLHLHLRRLLLPQNHKTYAAAKRHAEEEFLVKTHADEFNNVHTVEVNAVSTPRVTVKAAQVNSSKDELTTAIKAQQENIVTLTNMLGNLQTQVQSLMSKSTVNSRQVGPRCYRCNRLGHIARNCMVNLSQVPNNNVRARQFSRNIASQQGNARVTPNTQQVPGQHILVPLHLHKSTSNADVSNNCTSSPINPPNDIFCYSVTKHKLPPFSENILKVSSSLLPFSQSSVLIEPLTHHQHSKFCVARSVNSKHDSNEFFIKVANFSPDFIHINKGMKLATLAPVNASTPDIQPVFSTSLETGDQFEPWGGQFDLSHLPEQQKHELMSLIDKYKHIFASSVTELTGCDTILHNINLKDNIPVRQKPYRVPYHLRQELDKQIAELLEAKIIEESDSAYSAPVILVRKQDGSYRLVTDFRKLNEKTVEDSFPLPNMFKLIEGLANATYFSTLDLTSGFFQMKIHPEDTYKSVFTTPSGHYHWTRVAFGLRNAPSFFQRLMSIVLANLSPLQIGIYIDDIVIASNTFEEHLNKFNIVFDRLALLR